MAGIYNWGCMLGGLDPQIDSGAQLVAWTAALDSGLRLLPVLADLQLRWRQQGRVAEGAGAEALVQAILLLWASLPHTASAFVACQLAAGTAISQQHQQLLWQMHSIGCRLVHWAAAPANHQWQAALAFAEGYWQLLLGSLAKSFSVCSQAMGLEPGALPAEAAVLPIAG